MHHPGTSPDIQTEVMIDVIIFKKNLIPVICRVSIRRIFFRPRTSNSLFRISGCRARVPGQQGLIIHPHISYRIHHVDRFRGHTSYRLVTHGSVHATFFSFFRGYKNYPVCPSSSIHGCCRGIFHHAECLDILRGNTGQIHLGYLDAIQ